MRMSYQIRTIVIPNINTKLTKRLPNMVIARVRYELDK